ncbi:hypothetical protein, partial [Pseudoxanthomonas sp. J35]|uniref:tetratricopeptide repeat protein n=1 Tax=Pseudoxanthomonas sp. J35 TaxID=935852 RepID=UPI0004B08E23
MQRPGNIWLWLVAFIILGLAIFVYLPGLSGGFLFDDFANLPALGRYGAVESWTTFWRYITSGTADPIGRPLSLLTFLIDANDWPANPRTFKQTNLTLHLINGILLGFLLARLTKEVGVDGGRAVAAAILGAGLWLLHPLFVSTTLYIVQRETMLPGTFILLGLTGYFAGRERARRGQWFGVFLAGGSLLVCTVLGVLSKGNGALLPVLAWLLDVVLLGRGRPPMPPRVRAGFVWMRRVCIVLPALIVLIYLAKVGWNGFLYGMPPHRPWTLGERLMTEARVVTQYLGLLWSPRPYTTGLFNDAVVISNGLFQPITTFFSVSFLIGLGISAWLLRRRWPAWAAAVSFFFVAHLMESSVVALELYYEHRNYVPAFLMFWPLALWLVGISFGRDGVPQPVSTFLGVRVLLAGVLPLTLAGLTWMRADLWGNTDDQAAVWALRNPDSPRAQAYAAQLQLARGDLGGAIDRLEKLRSRLGADIHASLNLVGAKCHAGTLRERDLELAGHALRTTRSFERMGYDWFVRSIDSAARGGCKGMDLNALHQLLQAARENPYASQIPGRVQDIFNLEGRIALAKGDFEAALEAFDKALEVQPRPGVALAQAAMLGGAGAPEAGLQHLDRYEQLSVRRAPPAIRDMAGIHERLLESDGYWEKEFPRLRSQLEAERAFSAD